MTEAPGTTVPSFPFGSADPSRPPGDYQTFLRTDPVSRVRLPTGDLAWLVTRHRDVRTVLSDPRFSRHALTEPGAPQLAPVPPFPSLFYLDPPRHTRLRELAGPALGVERTARFAARISRVVDSLLDPLEPPVDLLAAVARPLPMAVLCAVLGIPDADAPRFAGWLHRAFDFASPPPPGELMTLFGLLHGYVEGLIAARRQRPGDDLLSDLVHAELDGDRLTNAEVFALLFDLVGAGDMPVTAEIAHLLLNLLRQPGLLTRLHAEPALVDRAVEELLRLSQSAGGGTGSLRITTAEVELGGVSIPAGAVVVPCFNAANQDDEVFPDGVDVTRSPNPHLTFSAGAHHCIGAPLGRLELRTLVAGLAARRPDLALVGPEDELDWPLSPVFRTPARIPVQW
jgi:cytochrome P450